MEAGESGTDGGDAGQGGMGVDSCLDDPNKTRPGECGCGVPDDDSDGDGAADCKDDCPKDRHKLEAGVCGCGTADTDRDGDGAPDCIDGCPDDERKSEPGFCGCGKPDGDCPGSATEVAQISSSIDDAEELVTDNASYSAGHIALDSSDLEMTNDDDWHGHQQIIGLRFSSVGIPRKAVIERAVIRFVADDSNSEATSLSISVQASDNAAPFSISPFDLSTRTQVPVVSQWDVVPWSVDATYDTPDFSAALQAVVDRDGWSSGNAIVVLIGGTGIREAVAYDQSPQDAASLHVSYSP